MPTDSFFTFCLSQPLNHTRGSPSCQGFRSLPARALHSQSCRTRGHHLTPSHQAGSTGMEKVPLSLLRVLLPPGEGAAC